MNTRDTLDNRIARGYCKDCRFYPFLVINNRFTLLYPNEICATNNRVKNLKTFIKTSTINYKVQVKQK